MKERPILFSAPMVRAILAGNKTQTRRVVKPKDAEFVDFLAGQCDGEPGNTEHLGQRIEGDKVRVWCAEYPEEGSDLIRCPYGKPGDRLWVREAWRVGAWNEDVGAVAIDYKADGHCRREWLEPAGDDDGEIFNRLWQQSTDDAIKAFGNFDRYKWEPGQSPCRWRPSIHMPRWASRITLEIVSVRVERLQEISEADARAEGARCADEATGREVLFPSASNCGSYRLHYRDIWEQINGPDSWAANPWVWVVEFKRVEA